MYVSKMDYYWKVVSAAGLGVGLLYIGYKLGKGHVFSLSKENPDHPLSGYIRDHNKENPILHQLRQMSQAHQRGKMTTGVESGKLLTLLCRLIKAEKVLDVGVFTGCSSFAMALALPESGKVVACDINDDYAKLGRPYWEQGGVAGKIDLRIQPASKTLQELIDNGEEETFDLMFIDADKSNYPKYFELGMKLLRPGGLFVVDNALWYGRVADPSVNDSSTTGIRKINELMKSDPWVDFTLVHVGDGTGIAQKL